ncbi:MAG: hypothetical protein U0165_10355 [Polyangiaceae bacterium]
MLRRLRLAWIRGGAFFFGWGRKLKQRTLPLAFAGATLSSIAFAAAPIESIEVQSLVSRDRDLKPTLRKSVEKQIAAVDWGKNPQGKFVLSTSLVQLDTEKQDGASKVSATVSVTLRDRSGSIKAMIEGRAQARDAADAAERAELGAIDAAVEGAVRAVPEAIKRVK